MVNGWCRRWLQSHAGLSVTEPAAAKSMEDMTSNMLLLSLKALQAWAIKPTSEDNLIQVSARKPIPFTCLQVKAVPPSF